MKSNVSRTFGILVAVVAFAMGPAALGGNTYYWRSGSNDNWSASRSWQGSPGYPNNIDDVAQYAQNAAATTTQDVAGLRIGTLMDTANGLGTWTIRNNSNSNSITFQVSSGSALIQSGAGANVYIYPDIVLKSAMSMSASNSGSVNTFGIASYGSLAGTGDVFATAYGSATATRGATLTFANLNNSGAVTINTVTNSSGPATVTITTIGPNVTNLTKIGTYGTVTVSGGNLTCPIVGDSSQTISKTGTNTLEVSGDSSATFSGRWTLTTDGKLRFDSTNAVGSVTRNVLVPVGCTVIAGCPILTQAFVDHFYPNVYNVNLLGVLALGTNADATSLIASNVYIGSIGTNTFSGTFAPASSSYNYYLGGGGGTLILTAPNVISGTYLLNVGPNLAYVTNGGGEVVFNNTNSYNGTIRLETGYTLTTPYLANVGVPSGIGLGAAADLSMGGGTLKYTGPGASIDRTFTLYLGGRTSTVDASGSGALKFTNSAALSFNLSVNGTGDRGLILSGTNTNDNTFGLQIPFYTTMTGNVSLAKTGPGTWILANTNTYSGATTISGGVLRVNGAISTSVVSVVAGTLAGTGTIASNVSVTGATSVLAPGDPVGVLRVGTVSLDSNATFAVTLNGAAAGQYSQLQVTNGATLGNSTLSVKLGFTSSAGKKFTILHSGGLNGQFACGNQVKTDTGVALAVTYTGTDVVLSQAPAGSVVLFL